MYHNLKSPGNPIGNPEARECWKSNVGKKELKGRKKIGQKIDYSYAMFGIQNVVDSGNADTDSCPGRMCRNG